ncbi:hypothetical protein BJF79_17700 [Actinomadura sp. CNU-125]|nr:hypothetical protein [Actinomadura sp. CNU-125]OLT17702.1 hypothetical protein BJF79_17700 [Actinomadura sp. CNU-125]
MSPQRWSRALLGSLLAAGALAAVSAPADAAPPPTGGLTPGKAWKVTLLTGDVVSVRTAEGEPPLVSVTPAPGREKGAFRKEIRPDGHVVVTPMDVAGLVGRVIDPELFDVTSLIKQGYDDARSKDLPLIVRQSGGPRALSALGGGLDKTKDLPSIDAVAVRQPKKEARGLGETLSTKSAKSTGIEHIWLDGKVEATFAPSAPAAHRLDRNLRQVGAPAACAPGTPARARRSPSSTAASTPATPTSKDASPRRRTSPNPPTPPTASATGRTSPRRSPAPARRPAANARASPRTRTC